MRKSPRVSLIYKNPGVIQEVKLLYFVRNEANKELRRLNEGKEVSRDDYVLQRIHWIHDQIHRVTTFMSFPF